MDMAYVMRVLADLPGARGPLGYRVRICGRQRADGTWEGWTEFDPHDGSPVLRSPRETTQPNRPDLEYWASGLTPVYLEGALRRAVQTTVEPTTETVVAEQPTFEAPAPDVSPARAAGASAAGPVRGAVMDPFSVYAKGETLLRRQLRALSAQHLRGILRAYELVDEGTLDLEALNEVELAELIVVRVARSAAA
jgi:hypothetical protein